jgi:hypothetical protein
MKQDGEKSKLEQRRKNVGRKEKDINKAQKIVN